MKHILQKQLKKVNAHYLGAKVFKGLLDISGIS